MAKKDLIKLVNNTGNAVTYVPAAHVKEYQSKGWKVAKEQAAKGKGKAGEKEAE